MATLRDYTEEYRMVYEMASDPDADEESFNAYLAKLGDEIEKKANNIGSIITELNGDVNMLDGEGKRIAQKKATAQNRINSLKRYLETCMIESGKTKFKTDLYSFGIQKNTPSVEIAPDVDIEAIPEEYVKVTKEINKTAVKDALKEGKELNWARLQQTESIRIR